MAKPAHIAFIIDGNRRWAKKRLLPALLGHRQGVKTLKNTLLWLIEEKIEFASFYCFSTENWTRALDEVEGLMGLIEEYFSKGESFFKQNDIKVEIFGDKSRFSKKIRQVLQKIEKKTANAQTLKVGFCLNYGGREDILQAANKAIKQGAKKLSQKEISQNLYTKNFPDPDLVIRTSGEERLSNFMLWQISYSELCFLKKLWPDFEKEDLKNAIEQFSKRTRRFGGN